MSEELVGALFGGEVVDAESSMKMDAELIRQTIISEIDDDIEVIRKMDVRSQKRYNQSLGPLATGAIVISGGMDAFDFVIAILDAQKKLFEEMAYEEILAL